MNEYRVEIFLPGYGWDRKTGTRTYAEALSEVESLMDWDKYNDVYYQYRIKDSDGEVLYES